MRITLHGAANEVTGSSYQVQTDQASVMVDFGAFQGSKFVETRNKIPKALNVAKLNAIVLTHGHLDHVGRLPLLVKRGYHGPIYASSGTIDVAGLILRDSAHVMEMETERLNRQRMRAGEEPIQPMFNADDVDALLRLMQPLPYNTPTEIAKGIRVHLVEAGHLLGSTSVVMQVDEPSQPGQPSQPSQPSASRTVVFSGDIGPKSMPVLRESAVLTKADWVFMESTYGDRDHRPLNQTVKEFADLVRAAVQRKGKIIVPSFAVGRTQQMLYHLAELFRSGEVPPFPIYVDSPMAIAANALYAKHPELYDAEMNHSIANGNFTMLDKYLNISQSSDDSKAINSVTGTCLILAGAGMCNAGRVLHHLKHNLWRPETTVIIVGYQAPGSLGRNLLEGKNPVSIFGERIAVNATVRSLGGFSAHAGQSELVQWFSTLAPSRPRLTLAHGEDRGRKPLARIIEEKFAIQAELPITLDTLVA